MPLDTSRQHPLPLDNTLYLSTTPSRFQQAQLREDLAKAQADLEATRRRESEAASALEQASAQHQRQIAELEAKMAAAVRESERSYQALLDGLPPSEITRLHLKVQALTENYSKVKKKNVQLQADLEFAIKRADMAKAETTQLQESQNLESTILSEQHYMQKCVELEQLHKAYQGSVEKVAALTNTTLDQAAEIYRLNELTRRLFDENRELVGQLRAVQNTQARGVWVPAM